MSKALIIKKVISIVADNGLYTASAIPELEAPSKNKARLSPGNKTSGFFKKGWFRDYIPGSDNNIGSEAGCSILLIS